VLDDAPRPGAQQVVVLLSDGNHIGDVADVEDVASELRARGVILFTIGLGADADDVLLARIATDGAYYRSPIAADLQAIYRRLLESLACIPSDG
jgi:hypothetical protein